MKITTSIILSITAFSFSVSCNDKDTSDNAEKDKNSEVQGKEKPTQHLKLPDITSKEKAVEVMKTTTEQLKNKTKLDAQELSEIHVITYSLEKAVAYFVEKSEGDRQAIAKEMAEVVEEVHLNSENNKPEKTKVALQKYFQLEQSFNNKNWA